MFRACIEHLITRQIDKQKESFNLVTIVRVQLERMRRKMKNRDAPRSFLRSFLPVVWIEWEEEDDEVKSYSFSVTQVEIDSSSLQFDLF